MPIETTYSHNLQEPTIAGAVAGITSTLARESELRAINNAAASAHTAPGKWSRKEILGHLVDSAGNNVQRFVRAQIPAHLSSGVLRGPGYEQMEWVKVQSYRTREWAEVVDLWIALNRHIVHIINAFDRDALGTPCVIGDGPPKPIEHVVVDYAGHLVHHFRQITGTKPN